MRTLHFLLAAALLSPLTAFAASTGTLPAQAEVTASSGPVQLTLRIYETKISTKEGFWFQIELKNIGKSEFLVTDLVFWDSFQMAYATRENGIGTRLEVLDPDGKRIKSDTLQYEFHSLDEPLPGPYVEETPEVTRLRSEWRAQGVPEPEIRNRLIKRQSRIYDQRARDSRPKQMLQPGSMIVTPPWADTGWSLYHSAPYPIDKDAKGQFAEASYYRWKKPGIYRVRAIYNHRLRSELVRKYPDLVEIATPWVKMRVGR
ncbi:MAG: hypothetical protein HY925_11815 [Elusimicrobia bacterium]|nr:hypothetical protein [Elusimicrobiota bacterium]